MMLAAKCMSAALEQGLTDWLADTNYSTAAKISSDESSSFGISYSRTASLSFVMINRITLKRNDD